MYFRLNARLCTGLEALGPAGGFAAASAAAGGDDDDEIDLFGSDEEEDEEAEKLKAQRLEEYNKKKAAKPKEAAKVGTLMPFYCGAELTMLIISLSSPLMSRYIMLRSVASSYRQTNRNVIYSLGMTKLI